MPRPKSFDPDTVLAKAMGVFWEKGYDAASISDLTAAMGINRFSLYDTFGDKHQLYLKTLDAYTNKVAGPILERIAAINSLDGFELFFADLIEFQHSEDNKPCCMMQKAAISMGDCDQAARERVDSARLQFHVALRDAFYRIESAAGLRKGLDVEDAARLIMVVQAGLSSYNSSPIPKAQAKALISLLIGQFRA